MSASDVKFPSVLSRSEAEELRGVLISIWRTQTRREPSALEEDLDLLKEWFDPVAKGERLRRAVRAAPERPVGAEQIGEPLVYLLPNERVLLTPEGRVAIDTLRDAVARVQGDSDARVLIDFRDDDVELLVDLYRRWSRQRLDDVVGLLEAETSTLRPGAAGLLLVLLVNRNIGEEQALPRPRDPAVRATVETAIRGPALAWATEFTGKQSPGAGLDLYRGWVIPELARRLGSGLKGEIGEPLFIEADAVETAVTRLVDDLRRRPAAVRRRIPRAWDAMMRAYKKSRPQLASLGLAFERPSFTRELERELLVLADREIAKTSEGERPN